MLHRIAGSAQKSAIPGRAAPKPLPNLSAFLHFRQCENEPPKGLPRASESLRTRAKPLAKPEPIFSTKIILTASRRTRKGTCDRLIAAILPAPKHEIWYSITPYSEPRCNTGTFRFPSQKLSASGRITERNTLRARSNWTAETLRNYGDPNAAIRRSLQEAFMSSLFRAKVPNPEQKKILSRRVLRRLQLIPILLTPLVAGHAQGSFRHESYCTPDSV